MYPSSLNSASAPACFIIRHVTALLVVVLLLQGCAKYQYKPEPVNTGMFENQINSWSIDNPELKRFLLANGMHHEDISTGKFSLQRLFLTALFYHPEMYTAYKKWQQSRIVAEHSGFRIDPTLSIPFEHHSDTSGGQSQWTIGAVLSFIYERKEKREARQAEAEVELLNARLAMDQLAMDIYGQIEEHYRNYLVSKAQASETNNEIEVLKELLAQLENKFELGSASQFEISTIKLELQQRQFEYSLQENLLQEHKDRLLSMTQLAHTELDGIEIEYIHPLGFTRALYENEKLSNTDISLLQSGLLDTHLDLAQRLNDYAQSEANLRLEIEKQYPDIVLSPGFIFDQSDNIWKLGASWILPLFPNTEQDLLILKALAERKIKQQEIIAVQKKLLNQLYQNYKSVIRHGQSIQVSDRIVESVEQRAIELEKQIELGGIDSISLLRNRMEYYKAKQTQLQIYYEAITAILALQQLLQHAQAGLDPVNAVTLWLANLQEKDTDEPDL